MFIGSSLESDELKLIRAQRTSYVAKLIVHREDKCSPAHQILERLVWHDLTPYLELHAIVEAVFKSFYKNSSWYKSDLKRALLSAKYLSSSFIDEYNKRATKSFLEALLDYERSIILLFGADYLTKVKGWTPASTLARNYKPIPLEKLASKAKNLQKFSKWLHDFLTQDKPK